MTKGFLELVGLQVTFSKVMPQYTLTHIYQHRANGHVSGPVTKRAYSYKRILRPDKIVSSLRDAYSGAIRSIWKRETLGCLSEYLQFVPGAAPRHLPLPGRWHHWAQL